MTPDDARHGTNAGYRAHRTDKEPACGPCCAANTAYMAEYRSNPARRRRAAENAQASTLALSRLVDGHRDEYERLRVEELTEIRRRRETS